MRLNEQKYLEFGKTMTIQEQEEFVKKTKNIILAIKLNPDIFLDGLEEIYKMYPKFKECIEY